MEETCKIHKKWALNQNCEKLSDAFGISEDRAKVLNSASSNACIRAFVTDHNVKTKSQLMEIALNESVPKSLAEAILLGYFIGKDESKFDNIAKALAKSMQG